jgi:hypothetical protein
MMKQGAFAPQLANDAPFQAPFAEMQAGLFCGSFIEKEHPLAE